MRILQLISQTRVGGAEAFAHALSAELASRGHGVLLAANRANGELFARERPPGMEVRALSRKSRLDLRIVTFLLGTVRRFRPEIIHSHNFEANTWARALGILFPGCRVVCHEHSSLKINQPRRRVLLDRLLFHAASAVIVVNRPLFDLLRTRHRVPEGKLVEVANGIDAARFRRPPGTEGLQRDACGAQAPGEARGGDSRAKEVVCVGSLIAVKNHELLLDAWSDVLRAEPRARLTLVGEGPLRPVLEAQAARLGLGTGPGAPLEFAGARADIRPFLWRALIFVLPSHLEALPLSLLEARAAGLACVASAVGGIPEAMGDESMGRLVPPRDREALVSALLPLLRAPDLCAAMGERAREDVTARYGMTACAGRCEEIYRQCLRRAHRQAGWKRVVKSVFDHTVAFFGLLLALPLLVPLGFAVLFTMGSPVLFSQLRPGFRGRPFRVVKFRTMNDRRDAQGGLLPDAERLTGLGRLMRAASLDELPQLWNVLKGDLSLVGPRPLLMRYLDRYTEEQARRHDVLPGITGWAQVNGRNAISWDEKFALDVWYVDHWSLRLDLKILFLTVGRVLRGSGVSQEGHVTMREFMGEGSDGPNGSSGSRGTDRSNGTNGSSGTNRSNELDGPSGSNRSSGSEGTPPGSSGPKRREA